MNVLNLRTGEPFDPLPRLHHREESALQVSSSEHSGRARGMLLSAKSFYIYGKKLPYDRTVPYVTLNGNQWFNMGISIRGESRLKCETKVSVSVNSDCCICGYRTVYNDSFKGPNFYMKGVEYQMPNGSTGTFSGAYEYNTDFGIILEYGYSSDTVDLYVNGGLYGSRPFDDVKANVDTVPYFGALNLNGTASWKFKGKCHYYKITGNEKGLLVDYVPVIKDGVAYMYDRVTNAMLRSEGNEDFGYVV